MKLQVGGDFYYYAEKSEQKPDLLLIAGGVGINPLISTMRHAEDLNEGSGGHSEHFGKLMLLYSARTKEELIFHVSIIPCADPECFVRGGPTLTKKSVNEGGGSKYHYKRAIIGTSANALNGVSLAC